MPLFTTYGGSSVEVFYPACLTECVPDGFPAPPPGAFIAPNETILTTPPGGIIGPSGSVTVSLGASVPEPSTWLMLAFSIPALLLLRRKWAN